jgi:hypothetical protein
MSLVTAPTVPLSRGESEGNRGHGSRKSGPTRALTLISPVTGGRSAVRDNAPILVIRQLAQSREDPRVFAFAKANSAIVKAPACLPC